MLQIVLTAAALIAFVRFGRRAQIAIELAALTLLGFLAATFLADRHPVLPIRRRCRIWLFLFGMGFAIALVSWFTTDRHGVTTLIVALGILVGLIVVDVATGARLQFNTVFGYSPTVAGRFAGLGNLGYAQLAAGAVLLAGLVAFRIGGRRGARRRDRDHGDRDHRRRRAVLRLRRGRRALDGSRVRGDRDAAARLAHPLEADRALRARDDRIGRDLRGHRPVAARRQAHAPRAADHVGRRQGRLPQRVDVILQRKLSENTGVLFGSIWTIMLPVVLAGIAYLIYRAPGRMRGLHERMPAAVGRARGTC